MSARRLIEGELTPACEECEQRKPSVSLVTHADDPDLVPPGKQMWLCAECHLDLDQDI